MLLVLICAINVHLPALAYHILPVCQRFSTKLPDLPSLDAKNRSLMTAVFDSFKFIPQVLQRGSYCPEQTPEQAAPLQETQAEPTPAPSHLPRR